MGFLTIFTVFLLAALVAVKYKEDFYDTFPVTVSALILLMYALAFVKGLPLIDAIMGGILAGVLLGGLWLKGPEAKDRLKESVQMLFSWQSLVLFFACVGITFMVKDKAALWWDDINYWAVDAKALYYNGGFAGKYGNVAPEFGDYPPAIQLFKWFFLHLSPDGFKEGLMFGAYHCLNLIYTIPLLKKLPKNNPFLLAAGMVGLFLLPGIVDGIAKEGTCADVTMGIVYGAFLWSVVDDKEHMKGFYSIRLMLYGSVLVLTKSVGIEWAFFGIVFFAWIRFYREKESGTPIRKIWIQIIKLTLVCGITEGSWLLFCLLNRRVAKLTGAAVRTAVSGDFSFLNNTYEKMKIYADGFIRHPMHGEHTWGLDLSSAGILILFFIVIFLYKRYLLISKQESKRIALFTALTAFVAYGIIFLGHITIFSQELQYQDSYVMAKSIARYGAPFTLGLLYLFMGILMEKKKTAGFMMCMAAIVLTTSLPGAYQTVYGYRASLEQDLTQRNAMVETEAELFQCKIRELQSDSENKNLFQTRTLYLRDNNTIHWVKDTYISFEVAPVPVVYGGIASDMDKGSVEQTIRNSHALYLYADKVDGEIAYLFEDMLETGFECETFYRIEEENGAFRLIALK